MYYVSRFAFLGIFIFSFMWVSGWAGQANPQRGYASTDSYSAPAPVEAKFYYSAAYKL